MAVVAARGVSTGRANGDVPSGRNNADVSQREDLANFISMITRDETPFMSSIGKTKATAIYHEWQTDELAPPGNSRLSEGFDYQLPTGYTLSGGAITGTGEDAVAGGGTQAVGTGANQYGAAAVHTGPNRTRLGNYAQINGKTIAVSGTRRAIDQAGVADEYAYQLKKRGTELRRDVEMDLVGSVNTAGSSGVRTMGTYRAWISAGAATVESNELTAASALGQGTAVGNHAAATKRSLSLSQVDSVMQSIYEEGGKATKIMVSPKLRRDFSDLMVSDSGVRRNLDEKGKLRQSVDVYMSDFGDLMVVPNYVMGLGTLADEAAFIYDPQWFAMATLRPLQEVEVGQRGDSTIGMFVEEQTFEVKNPLGSGAIYGLN